MMSLVPEKLTLYQLFRLTLSYPPGTHASFPRLITGNIFYMFELFRFYLFCVYFLFWIRFSLSISNFMQWNEFSGRNQAPTIKVQIEEQDSRGTGWTQFIMCQTWQENLGSRDFVGL